MDEAFRCDAVLLMREGRLLATTTASELLERTGGTTLDDAFLRLIRSAERTARAPDAAPIISGRQEVAR
jgi:ABC superfamily ATP binding cassette transporter, ABC protein